MAFPVPEYIQLYPTLRCNQHCSFCFNDTSSETGNMSRGDASKLLDAMEAHGIGELDIMGGEPFILPWMPDFLREAVDREIAVNISTNGSITSALKKLDGIRADLMTIGISLEGSTPGTHERLTRSRNFLTAIDSLQWLLGAGLDPLVKTVVSADTAGDIQPIIDLVRQLGVRRYFLIHMDHFSHDTSFREKALGYQEYMQMTDKVIADNSDMEIGRVTASCFNGTAASMKVRCAGGTKKIAVMPDGSVLPCNLFQGFPEFRLGNIFSDALQFIMSQQQLDYFRTFDNNPCTVSDCGNRALCTGGCPAHGYYHYRDLEAPDIRCLTSQCNPRPRCHNGP
ncbi:MAG: radical SAM protein [Thermodesulfovibrionales bacterium]